MPFARAATRRRAARSAPRVQAPGRRAPAGSLPPPRLSPPARRRQRRPSTRLGRRRRRCPARAPRRPRRTRARPRRRQALSRSTLHRRHRPGAPREGTRVLYGGGMPRPFGLSTGEPPDRPEDPAVRRANLRRAGALVSAYPPPPRPRPPAVLGLIVFSAMLGVVPAFLLRGVLQAIQENDTKQLSLDAAAMIAIAIVTGVLGVWQTLLSNQ